jgi:branched-chain amino acid transport system ATP-binding protein
MSIALEIDNLVAGYRSLPVLHQVSLHVPAGATVGVLGPNGAGKSTVLRAISGLIGVMEGRIRIDGVDTTGRAPGSLARAGVVHVPEGRGLFPQMTVEENLALGTYSRRGVKLRSELEAIYSRFPALHNRRKLHAASLSGGEQSLLAIGRALMGQPRLLLLDEPTLGLAPIAIANVKSIVSALHEEGITILLIEQNVALAEAVADALCVLENGRVVFRGTPAELDAESSLADLYLGSAKRTDGTNTSQAPAG